MLIYTIMSGELFLSCLTHYFTLPTHNRTSQQVMKLSVKIVVSVGRPRVRLQVYNTFRLT